MPKSSQKKGGAKKEYTGTYRHFTLHEVNGKEVEIGTADIKDHQTPLSAAKKLLSSYCRHEGIKSNERNKVNITFTIRETTRGHSKVYGPYKGKFVKYDKPLMIKLKSGKVIKRLVKPMVKLAKGSNNKKMVGGQSNGKISVRDKLHLQELIRNTNTNFSKLDVSNVTDMSRLFENFEFLYRAGDSDISNWNVSNVTNMSNMFYNSKDFNQNLNNWNGKLLNVNDMSKMFSDCIKFKNGSDKNHDIPLTWTLKDENVTMKGIFTKGPLFNVTYCANSEITTKYPPDWKKYVAKLNTDRIKLNVGKKYFIQIIAEAGFKSKSENFQDYNKQYHEWVEDPKTRLAEYTFDYIFKGSNKLSSRSKTCYLYTGELY